MKKFMILLIWLLTPSFAFADDFEDLMEAEAVLMALSKAEACVWNDWQDADDLSYFIQLAQGDVNGLENSRVTGERGSVYLIGAWLHMYDAWEAWMNDEPVQGFLTSIQADADEANDDFKDMYFQLTNFFIPSGAGGYGLWRNTVEGKNGLGWCNVVDDLNQ